MRREKGIITQKFEPWYEMNTSSSVQMVKEAGWTPFRLEDDTIAWENKDKDAQRIYDTDLMWQELELARYEQERKSNAMRKKV